MRVAYVCMDPGVPVFGSKGASIHVQEWIRAACACGAEVELFAARLDGDAPADLASLPIHLFAVDKARHVSARERAIERADSRMREALQSRGDFDLVYTRHALFCHSAMRVARDRGWMAIEEVNAPLVEEQQRHRRLADVTRARELRRDSFSAAAAIVAVSENLAIQIRSEAGATPIATIPNGVNIDRFRPDVEPTWLRPKDAFVVAFAGSLKPWHGLSGLMDAFARLRDRVPRAHLLVIGDGSERPRLEEWANREQLEGSLSLVGARPHDEVPGLLASADVAVAPYPRVSDGDRFYFSPLKVAEYLAMGLPVVASGIGQVESMIEDGRDGLLVPPGEPAVLAEALERIALDSSLARELSRLARRRASQQSWSRVVQRTLALAYATKTGPSR